MSVPTVSAPAVIVAAAPARGAPSPRPAKSPVPQSSQGVANQPAATVTISDAAKNAASTSHQQEPVKHQPASPPPRQATTSTQTSASSYVAKVRAALTSNPDLTLSQAMSAAGVPQAEQQQISAALGSAKQNNT